MIILKLKDGTEEWVDKMGRETVDGISYITYEIKTKKGKTHTGAYQASEVLGLKDVGEREEKTEA